MRGQELLDRMELVDPELVEAADKIPKKNRKALWGTLAACACIAIAVLTLWKPQQGKANVDELTETTYQTLAELGFQANVPAEAEGMVSWCDARIHFTEGEDGKIIWMDFVPGLVYSLSVESGASEELLIEMANRVFNPAQGE